MPAMTPKTPDTLNCALVGAALSRLNGVGNGPRVTVFNGVPLTTITVLVGSGTLVGHSVTNTVGIGASVVVVADSDEVLVLDGVGAGVLVGTAPVVGGGVTGTLVGTIMGVVTTAAGVVAAGGIIDGSGIFGVSFWI